MTEAQLKCKIRKLTTLLVKIQDKHASKCKWCEHTKLQHNKTFKKTNCRTCACGWYMA